MFETATLCTLNKGLGSNALWLGLSTCVHFVLGGAVGAYLAKMLRNLPRVIGLGVLLVAPFEFAFWYFLDDAAGAEGWFWTGLCLLSVASFGFGMAFGGTVAYLGKSYRATLNPACGRVVGSFFWWVPLAGIMIHFIVYLVGGSLVWGIIVAVLTVLVACVWLLRVPRVLPAEGHMVVDNEGTVA